MNASFDLALSAARAACGMQHYPDHTLYVVATPIGNLADITLRSLHVLQLMDAIACEDTRHTSPLLRQYGIDKPLLAVHEHNELEAAQGVIDRLQRGERVAYVSDAGTPAVSDPGARLVVATRAAGLRVLPLPGASSITTVLSVAGVVGNGGFTFVGFLPHKAGERDQAIATLQQTSLATVILEAPHRIEALARAMAPLGDRLLTVGRELTKQFEDIATMAAQDFAPWLAANPQRTRGEFALVLHAKVAAPDENAGAEGLRVLQLLLKELPLKTAVKLAADITSASKNELYDAALKIKRADSGESAD